MTSNKNYWIDANLILRHITFDHKELSPKAKEIMREIAMFEILGYVNTLVLHEVIYVLEKIYKIPRKIIFIKITEFISFSGLTIIDLDKRFVKLALNDYQSTNVDFADCVYKQIALANDYTICSFDKDFKKLGVEVKSI